MIGPRGAVLIQSDPAVRELQLPLVMRNRGERTSPPEITLPRNGPPVNWSIGQILTRGGIHRSANSRERFDQFGLGVDAGLRSD